MRDTWLCPYCFQHLRGNEVLFLDEKGKKSNDLKAMEFYYQFESSFPATVRKISFVNPRNFEASQATKSKIGFFNSLNQESACLTQRLCPYCHHDLDDAAGQKTALHLTVILSERNMRKNLESVLAMIVKFSQEKNIPIKRSDESARCYSTNYLTVLRLDLGDFLLFITILKFGLDREQAYSDALKSFFSRRARYSDGFLIFLDHIECTDSSLLRVENQLQKLNEYGASNLEDYRFKKPSILFFDDRSDPSLEKEQESILEDYAGHIWQNIRRLFESFNVSDERSQAEVTKFLERVIKEYRGE